MRQREALLDVMAAGHVLTMDQLISRVSNRTGASVKASSLTVLMSRLRNQEGYLILSRVNRGVWTYYLRGSKNRERARREAQAD